MPDCYACGAPIEWMRAGGKNVAVDVHDASVGERRVIVQDGQLVQVAAGSQIVAPVVHDCQRTA